MKSCSLANLFVLLTGLWFSQQALAGHAEIDSGKLFGTWQAQELHPGQGNVETVFTIRDNRTFSGAMAIDNEIVWTYGGSWTLEGNRLTWHYTQSSLTLTDAHKTETDEILSVSEDTLTYRSGSRGSVSTLQRLQHSQP